MSEKAKSLGGVTQSPYRAIAQALEVIPRTLAQNCGATVIRTLTALRAKHATGGTTWGINGETGELADMNDLGIWDPLAVKLQVLKTAVEVTLNKLLTILVRHLLTDVYIISFQTAILLLRIDDIVSGSKKKSDDGAPAAQPTQESMME